jgi:phosphoribosyl-AMP cyclohydrolase
VDAIASFRFNSDGLIPAVVQDASTGEVLMLAYMNEASLRQTVESGLATYWSRSRQEFWVKGQTSGHVQRVRSISVDCDSDTVLLKVEQTGPACHENYRSCFSRDLVDGELLRNAVPLMDP